MRVQCFKATPFALGDQLFLNFDQIIPIQDAEDFTVSMARKTQDEIVTQRNLETRHYIRREFWAEMLLRLKGKTPIFQNSKPTVEHWLSTEDIDTDWIIYTMVYTRSYAGVRIELARPNKDENKRLFKELYTYKNEIEKDFEAKLNWESLDNKTTSRITYNLQDVDIFNREEWSGVLDFLETNMIKLERVFRDKVERLKL